MAVYKSTETGCSKDTKHTWISCAEAFISNGLNDQSMGWYVQKTRVALKKERKANLGDPQSPVMTLVITSQFERLKDGVQRV